MQSDTAEAVYTDDLALWEIGYWLPLPYSGSPHQIGSSQAGCSCRWSLRS